MQVYLTTDAAACVRVKEVGERVTKKPERNVRTKRALVFRHYLRWAVDSKWYCACGQAGVGVAIGTKIVDKCVY